MRNAVLVAGSILIRDLVALGEAGGDIIAALRGTAD